MAKKTPVYIDELATELGRAAHTIRQVIRDEALPDDLMPGREGGRQKLYWNRSQLPGLRKFFKERAARRGWPGSAQRH